MRFYYIVAICITVTLMGCDIPGYLHVKNCTESDAYYLMYSQADGISDTTRLKIPPDQTKGILFGFGQHWTNDRIEEYVSQIDKIEIVTVNDTIALTDKKDMIQYLQKRRKGLFKQTLKIRIE